MRVDTDEISDIMGDSYQKDPVKKSYDYFGVIGEQEMEDWYDEEP